MNSVCPASASVNRLQHKVKDMKHLCEEQKTILCALQMPRFRFGSIKWLHGTITVKQNDHSVRKGKGMFVLPVTVFTCWEEPYCGPDFLFKSTVTV